MDDLTRDLVQRIRRRYPEIPQETIAYQIRRVEHGVALLGDTPTLREAAELAVAHNLNEIDGAMDDGARRASR